MGGVCPIFELLRCLVFRSPWSISEMVQSESMWKTWCSMQSYGQLRTTSNEEEQEALAEKMDGMNRLASFLQVPRPENSNLTFHHLGMYDTDSREALLLIIVNCDPWSRVVTIMICSFDPLSNFSLSFVYTLQEQELVIADRVHCTDLPVLPRAERLSYKVSADFRMAERQR